MTDFDTEFIKVSVYSKLLVLNAQITNTKSIEELLVVLKDAEKLIFQNIKYLETKQGVGQVPDKITPAEEFSAMTLG